jgi:hypothetical protein
MRKADRELGGAGGAGSRYDSNRHVTEFYLLSFGLMLTRKSEP